MTTYYLYQDSPFYEKKLKEIKSCAKKMKSTVEVLGTETRKSATVEYRGRTRPIQGKSWINENKKIDREAVKIIVH